MERLVRGDIIVTHFPFSDFTSTIKRPSIVVANLPGDDLIICPITSKVRDDPYTVSLTQSDLKQGNLKVDSFIRAGRLVSIRKSLILYKFGSVNKNKIKEVLNTIIGIFKK